MQEISSLLRQRLSARQAPQAHPDPDLLTAYVEQTLGKTERAEVIRHLAACGDCREVVALSLPEQPTQPVLQPSAASRRFWSPAFRWSAALATVAIAAALVIEKPWHRTPGPELQSQQRATVTTPPTATAPLTSALSDDKSQPAAGSVTTGGLTANEESTRERGPIATLESQPTEKARAAPRRDIGPEAKIEAQKAPQPLIQIQQPRSLARVSSASAPASQPPAKDSGETAFANTSGDYVNTGVLNQTASNEPITLNGEAAADQSALPAPPTPKAGAGGNPQQARSAAPPITGGQISGSAFDYSVQTPQMDQSANAAAPANDKNTLEKMKFAQKVKTKITESAKAMGRLASPQPAMAQGFSNSLAAAPDTKETETDLGSKKASLQFHWRLTSDGILMKSTDLSQWHEAYPQGSDLQFRSVFTLGTGHQVWAGGNNGTLIHSWNGGVNWDTFKVPEAGSNDITGITIDDGWQIKTSDGQTLVSHDQGKTWVPLKQN
jgi:Putative zinc-finger